MPAGTLDMARNEFGRLVGFSRLHVRDEFAVLAHDGGPPRQREIETPAHGSQHFARRVRRGALTPGEIGNHKPFVGGEPSLDDVFPDPFVQRGALAGGPDGINPNRWHGFEITYFGQGRLLTSIHTLPDITHAF